MIIMTSVNEVSVERFQRLLSEDPEIQVWNGGQPQFAVLSMERYRALTAAAPSSVTSALFDVSAVSALSNVSAVSAPSDVSATSAPSDVSATSAPSAFAATAETSTRFAHTEPEKIGALVRRVFSDYCARNRLPREEVERLRNPVYSHSTFGIPRDCSMLKLYNPALPLEEQAKDRNGYNRYYARASVNYPLPFYGAEYLLCNHWTENRRAKFEQWARRWES